MAYENLLYEKKDQIAYITFNRPKVLNALNRKTMEELRDILTDARDDVAVRALEEGVGSIVDIDNSMKLGCGHPMGPFTLLDFVGLDTTYYIAHIMFDEFKERRFAPPPLLKRMVLAGWNGRKSGRGFYDYADPKNPKPVQLT